MHPIQMCFELIFQNYHHSKTGYSEIEKIDCRRQLKQSEMEKQQVEKSRSEKYAMRMKFNVE